MPHSAAVVVLTRVYVASPRHTLSAACGSFDYRRLPPSGVGPCILLLVRAAGGGPGFVPSARSKIKATHTDVRMYIVIPPAPFLLAIQASRNNTFIK